jgi:broad specificity phosphatase PhoE
LDARLTALGKQQCAQLQPLASKLYAEIELVVVSPMSRALETATLCFEQVSIYINSNSVLYNAHGLIMLMEGCFS